MGKISDALQKVMHEREKQKREEEKQVIKAPEPRVVSKRPVNWEPKKYDQSLIKSAATLKEKVINTKLTLEQRLRMKERMYLVNATNNSGVDAKVVAYHDYFSPLAEQYRTLRTNVKSCLKKLRSPAKLKMTRPIANTRTVAITSSVQGEGKTVTATNLAVSLAHDLDTKVLLIDCDLRKGMADNLLNMPHKPGLAEFLADHAGGNDVIYQTKINNLCLIPAGEMPHNPSELLGSKRMKMLLESLRVQGYNYIVLDTPPIFPFADAGVLGTQTDGVILVVQSRKTQAHTVRKTKEFLAHSRVNILGFVLTSADSNAPVYGNYYHYYNNKKDTN